jgi:hypothetical protein
MDASSTPARLVRRVTDGGEGVPATVDLVPWHAAFDEWGSTPAERAAEYPCDGLVDRPDGVLFRAVDIEAPAEVVFRWLCQLRVAPYSYDWVDNLGRRSPQELVDGLDELELGHRMMTIFELAAFEPGRSLTVDSTTRLFGRVAATYLVTATDRARSRLVVKLMFAAPPGLYGWVASRVLPAGDLVMMRKQLLTLKRLAERDRAVLTS